MRALLIAMLAYTALSSTTGIPSPKSRPIGAIIDDLLRRARETSPEVASAALDAQAARAKVFSAGTLPDPIASVENESLRPSSTSGRGSIEQAIGGDL